MGTNFYFNTHDESTHIGKRSAAGLYCWDCDDTLHKYGKNSIHKGPDTNPSADIEKYLLESKKQWYEECPHCGQKPQEEELEHSAPGRELGFNKSEPGRKEGVKSCSSFSWAKDPYIVLTKKWVVFDEYGRKYTMKKFKEILSECPIQFYDSIGNIFC